MQNGFSFNGVHCSNFGCAYIPAPEDRFAMPEMEVSSTDVTSRDGGYYHSSRYKSREFKLKCYFEDITYETFTNMRRWLAKDKVGKLVFDTRPDVYYWVRPTEHINPATYSAEHGWLSQPLFSGTFTVTLTAFNPFGFMRIISYENLEDGIMTRYSGILPREMMPALPDVADTDFLVYNPGTQRCETVIELAGSAPSGLVIRNLSNGSCCKIAGLPAEGSVIIDGTLGRVSTYYNSIEEDAFELHDEGYIILESFGDVYRDVSVQATSGSNQLALIGIDASESMIGLFVYVGDEWLRITDVTDEHNIVVAKNMETDEVFTTTITGMNELSIEGTDVALTTLSVTYVP